MRAGLSPRGLGERKAATEADRPYANAAGVGGAKGYDRGWSTVREQRDHRPLTRAPQACGHHRAVPRARPARLTWLLEFLDSPQEFYLSYVSKMAIAIRQSHFCIK